MQEKMQCAIYTRVSTDNQAEVEFNSCEAQEAKIRSFIKSQEDMVIYKSYSDPGFTGANLNRPGFQGMLEDIKDGHINLVIAYKIDRLTRSPRDFYHLIEVFESKGVDFLSVTERFDTSTPSGRLLRNIMLTFAQFERELASERTKDKLLQRAHKGLWNGATVPFGYKSKKAKLFVDEEAARIVQSIYEEYIATCSINGLYHKLQANRIKDNKGNEFSKNRLYYILRNPIYTGQIRYNNALYKGQHQSIISESTFQAAQDKHISKKRLLRVYKYYLLAGLVKCKDCGFKMTPCHTNKRQYGKLKRYYYYRCIKTFKKDWKDCEAKQINANRLENYIHENLYRISLDKHYLKSMSPQMDAQNGLGKNGSWSGFDPDQLGKCIKYYLEGLQKKKNSGKNLWAKQFIQSIIYSIDSIQINFLCSSNLPPAKKNIPEKKISGILKEKNTSSPGRARTYDLLVTL